MLLMGATTTVLSLLLTRPTCGVCHCGGVISDCCGQLRGGPKFGWIQQRQGTRVGTSWSSGIGWTLYPAALVTHSNKEGRHTTWRSEALRICCRQSTPLSCCGTP